MNWRVSALDRCQLISNSDAHSPQKLGREATLLDISFSYSSLRKALLGEEPSGLYGTIEFFPEEGKYHYDGHRNCHQCLSPAQTKQLGGKCPICGKKITVGVQHRVEELADREDGGERSDRRPFESLVPLPEVIAASTGWSEAGKKTVALYEKMLEVLGDEFTVLRTCPLEEIGRTAGPLVQEGIDRLRQGRVERSPGFDGEYGSIQLLRPFERDMLVGQTTLLGMLEPQPEKVKINAHDSPVSKSERTGKQEASGFPVEKSSSSFMDQLNSQQKKAVISKSPAIEVVAGPGTGKTKTLIARILYLIEVCGVKPGEITAVTFTNQAAEEMRERLGQERNNKNKAGSVTIGTFHSICHRHLLQVGKAQHLISEQEAERLAEQVITDTGDALSAKTLLQKVSGWKNAGAGDQKLLDGTMEEYVRRMEKADLWDFDDLLLEELRLEADASSQQKAFSYLLVDEFQDINPIQYQLILQWSKEGKGLFVIGDPDQSIYGFRGSDPGCFQKLEKDFPHLEKVTLVENYRSTPEILSCALGVIAKNPGEERRLEAWRQNGTPVHGFMLESDLAEGIFLSKTINRMVGGMDMLDAQHMADEGKGYSFSDIAVLYRTHHQGRMLERCLKKEGIPYTVFGRDDTLVQPQVRGVLNFFRFLLYPGDIPALEAALENSFHCPGDLTAALCEKAEEGKGLSPEKLTARWRQEYGQIGLVQLFCKTVEEFTPAVSRKSPLSLLQSWQQVLSLQEDASLEQLAHMAVFHKSMDSLLELFLLGEEQDVKRADRKQYSSGAVSLMTLHGSKGLEYPVVFLCGLSKGKLPLESSRYHTDIQEERRLFYVGMTRAKEELFLLCGQEASPFMEEIPSKSLSIEKPLKDMSPEVRQLSFF